MGHQFTQRRRREEATHQIRPTVNANELLRAKQYLYVYSEHVSGADYSRGTPFGEEAAEFSDSGCVGVDYEVRNNELLKQMALQMFPLSS